jgi:hypothetical protein
MASYEMEGSLGLEGEVYRILVVLACRLEWEELVFRILVVLACRLEWEE